MLPADHLMVLHGRPVQTGACMLSPDSDAAQTMPAEHMMVLYNRPGQTGPGVISQDSSEARTVRADCTMVLCRWLAPAGVDP